ncbi:uncharacterized protein LOC143008176 [Genypterus blacodes]|uniref:uncharacterized protein LOC143008176 n=1 Tax=Genypterus blacodes TaxID=154954 RepID=UPI003F76C52B
MSERCDSAGKVQENKPDPSEDNSGSPRSWIIDPSPSHVMFRSLRSPCRSRHSTAGTSSTDEGGPSVEDSGRRRRRRRRRRPSSLERSAEDEEWRREERKTKAMKVLIKLQEDKPRQPVTGRRRSNFEDFDFLAKYCIFSQEKLAEYKKAFEEEDRVGDGFLSCLQVLLALKNIVPPELLSEEEEIYVYRILEMVDFRVTDGLADLRLFAVIAGLAQKVAGMDDFMRSLINTMDFRSLEVRLLKAKQLFLFLLEEQPGPGDSKARKGDSGPSPGVISGEQLLLELRAGGIRLEQEAAVAQQLRHIPSLDLLDFLAYLPLFMLIHKSVISNPLNDSGSF